MENVDIANYPSIVQQTVNANSVQLSNDNGSIVAIANAVPKVTNTAVPANILMSGIPSTVTASDDSSSVHLSGFSSQSQQEQTDQSTPQLFMTNNLASTGAAGGMQYVVVNSNNKQVQLPQGKYQINSQDKKYRF